MEPNDESSGKWWRGGVSTRRHTYYAPTRNRQGQALFLLIVVLGLLAVVVAAYHLFQQHSLSHPDGILGLIGIGCLLLGIGQIRSLSQ